jgi:dTDP-4-dehydrorhamnose reductase
MEHLSRILILGSSSWMGSYLIPEFKKSLPHSHLICAYHSKIPHYKNVEIARLSAAHPQNLEALNPTAIINLARGEVDLDFEFHQYLIDFSNKKNAKYLFASSINAVDGDVSKSHLESYPAFAQTPYGKFKAKCETELLNRAKNALAFRFAGAHGWAPNRLSRTEDFLQQLAQGKEIIVGKNIIQNHPFMGDLAFQVSLLLQNHKTEGIYHLGTSDFSDEIVFLLKMANAFGYNSHKIIEGEEVNWNMVAKIERLPKEFPNIVFPAEKDTIAKIRAQSELAKYIKS